MRSLKSSLYLYLILMLIFAATLKATESLLQIKCPKTFGQGRAVQICDKNTGALPLEEWDCKEADEDCICWWWGQNSNKK